MGQWDFRSPVQRMLRFADEADRVLWQGSYHKLVCHFNASDIGYHDINFSPIEHVKQGDRTFDNDSDMKSRVKHCHSAYYFTDNCLGWDRTGTNDQFSRIITLEKLQVSFKSDNVQNHV